MIPPILHQHLSKAGKLGAAAQPREAKVRGGLAGAKTRWANRPLCPACKRPATPEQVAAGETVTKE